MTITAYIMKAKAAFYFAVFNQRSKIYIGYYTAARRYEFYFRVVKRIFLITNERSE